MKKWMFYLCCLLAGVGGFAGCSDDEEDNLIIVDDFNAYTDTGSEKIDFVLDDVPAYILGIDKEGGIICYSIYADDYFENREHLVSAITDEDFLEIENDIRSKKLFISQDEFFEYDIPEDCKFVYISAQVTNIGKLSDAWTYKGEYRYIRKAYLTGLRVRE